MAASIRHLWLLAWLFLVAVNGQSEEELQETVQRLTRLGRNCTFSNDEDKIVPGWFCKEFGICFDLKWICDRHTQCYPDDFDEEQGCQLYPETKCNSWGGRKHVECPYSHRCVLNIADCANDKPTDISRDASNSCPDSAGSPGPKWRCDDGLCIPMSNACDGHPDCQDGTDETKGCNLYPNTSCASWRGKKHIPCPDNSTVCTEEKYAETDCRACDNPDEWRCNSGWCIKADKYRNGIPDCSDGSDERTYALKWWALFLGTMTFSGAALFVSFVVRFINNRTNLLHCVFCQSKKSETAKKIITKMRSLAPTRGPGFPQHRRPGSPPDEADSVCYGYSNKGDVDSIEKMVTTPTEEDPDHFEQHFGDLPLKLIELIENHDNWKRQSLRGRVERNGQHLYAIVHQNPTVYRNLYSYLVFRYASPKRLKRATELLNKWELDFHNDDHDEVLKCWRLHLGSSEILKKAIESVQEEDICDTLYNKTLPFRNKMREYRRLLPEAVQGFFNRFSRLSNLIYFSLRPFFGACALYFAICKNITFAYLIYTSLYDMSHGNFLTSDYDFEAALLIWLIIAIGMVQVFFVIISAVYSHKVFYPCEHVETASPRRKLVITILSMICGPLMPAIILANYVYYKEQEYQLKRELQTHGCLEIDVGENEEEEAEEILKEKARDPDKDSVKVGLFRKIQRNRYKAALNRRIYSFYRVVQATIESFTMMVTLFLIMLVTPRPGRKINLMLGVEAKIAEFLDLASNKQTENATSFLEELDLIRDVTFATSLMYSFIMVISALARYVFQCKNKNMTLAGQFVLGIYFACHVVARMTVTIAFFSTAEMPSVIEAAGESEDETSPAISLLPAAIICTVFFVIQFVAIYLFKYIMVPEFRKADTVDQMVHVLANTLVVIPYATWDEVEPDEKEPADAKMIAVQKFKFGRRASIILPEVTGATGNQTAEAKNPRAFKKAHKRTHSAGAKITVANNKTHLVLDEEENEKGDAAVDTEVATNAEKIIIPNPGAVFKKIAVGSNVFDEIQKFWWKNPERKLTLYEIKEEFKSKGKWYLIEDERLLESTFQKLVDNGYINKKLFNPRRTKAEFFWLLAIQLFLNLLALTVEVVNGGAKTAHGLYYSWDVRLASFFMGLIFLALYYKKYHVMRRLTRFELCGCALKFCPVFLCFKDDEPMQAIPNDEEVQRCLSDGEMKAMETQTSIIEQRPADNDNDQDEAEDNDGLGPEVKVKGPKDKEKSGFFDFRFFKRSVSKISNISAPAEMKITSGGSAVGVKTNGTGLKSPTAKKDTTDAVDAIEVEALISAKEASNVDDTRDKDVDTSEPQIQIHPGTPEKVKFEKESLNQAIKKTDEKDSSDKPAAPKKSTPFKMTIV